MDWAWAKISTFQAGFVNVFWHSIPNLTEPIPDLTPQTAYQLDPNSGPDPDPTQLSHVSKYGSIPRFFGLGPGYPNNQRFFDIPYDLAHSLLSPYILSESNPPLLSRSWNSNWSQKSRPSSMSVGIIQPHQLKESCSDLALKKFYLSASLDISSLSL